MKNGQTMGSQEYPTSGNFLKHPGTGGNQQLQFRIQQLTETGGMLTLPGEQTVPDLW